MQKRTKKSITEKRTKEREEIYRAALTATARRVEKHFADGHEKWTIENAARREVQRHFAGEIQREISKAVSAYFASADFRSTVEYCVQQEVEERFMVLKAHFDQLIAEEIDLRLKAA